MIRLNVNSSSVVEHTNTLEKLHRSALPLAIRGTLNSAAFDVKQSSMPAEVSTSFTNRQPNFFRANSRVEMAKGWDIKRMQAVVGFVSTNLKGDHNHAVDDLQAQEFGGTINSRSFIPTNVARGGSNMKLVRPGNRLSNIKKIVNSNIGSFSKKQNFIKAVHKAGVGGYVIGNTSKRILWRIDGISRTGRVKLRMKALYSFSQNRSVRVKATGFMRSASLKSADKLDTFFQRETTKQIERLMK